MPPEFDLNFPRAWGPVPVSAGFRSELEDFQVDEVLGFEPSGSGEHWLVQLRKRGDNTDWVARELAQLSGVAVRDVGYAGRKDRRAVTSQWFSIYQPKGAEPQWQQLGDRGLELLKLARHDRKLRLGQHAGNRFAIHLRQLEPLMPEARTLLSERLRRLAEQGLPNYFGEQRFGLGAGNLHRAQTQLIQGKPIRNRRDRSMALSAARSWLFNRVLSERVRQGYWQTPLNGDPSDAASGPLWGRGRPLPRGDTLALEEAVLAPWANWCHALEHLGLKQERRALVLKPLRMDWDWEGKDLWLRFDLPPGCFATAVLREVAELRQVREQVVSGAIVL